MFNKNITIRCPKCKIPYVKVYKDGRQSFLKWYNGQMRETFIKGIEEVCCFNCGTQIRIPRLIRKVADQQTTKV